MMVKVYPCLRKRVVLLLALLLTNVSALTAQTLVVGSVNGVFDVSDLGAANYTIPIKLPPGIGGVAPSLSINYNSQGGNGILGMGWSLSGLSAISRQGSNLYNENKTQGTLLTSEDRYGLDGLRLTLISGTYGAAGSRYATETESYKLIDAVGTSGSGPAFFTVTDQKGWVYTYGGTTDSRVVQGSSVISWLLSKVVDLNGNEIAYTYSTTANESPNIAQIAYNGNTSQGLAAQTQVMFNYESRSDKNFTYVAGKKINQTLRLSFLTVTQTPPGGALAQVHKYKFEYQNDIYSHLNQVQESAGLNIEKVNPTNIDYGAAASIVAQDQAQLHAVIGLEYIPGDFNADGKTDYMVVSSQYAPSYNTWQLMKNTGNSFTKVDEGPLPAIPAVYDQNYLKRRPVYRNSTPAFFDFNSDGKDDFVYRTSAPMQGENPANGPTWDMNFFYILQSNGTGLVPLSRKIIPALPATSGNMPAAYQFYNSYPLIGDFDGNGKNEILVLKESNKYSATQGFSGNFLIGEDFLTEYGTDYLLAKQLQGMPFDASNVNEPNISGRSKLFVIDYDGDGKNEILSVWAGHAQVFKMNVTFDANKKPIVGNPAFIMVNETGYPTVWHDILTGDFNGDGITDVLTWAEGGVGWEIGYGNGAGLMNDIYPAIGALINKPSGANRFVSRPVVIGDYDGDGKDDIFDYTASVNASTYGGAAHAPKIHYSRGNNYFQTTYPSINVDKLAPSSETYILSDCNGDGALDFLTRNSINYAPTTFCFHPDENRHLVSKITNGLGAFTNINYGTLTNTSIYQPGSLTNTYPIVRRTIPFKVVSSIVDDNGVNTSGNMTTFKYEGLKYAFWGRGLLGFDKITRRNNVTLTSTEKSYSLNTTYFTPHLTDVVTSINGTITNTQKNEYGVKDFGNKRILPYITRTTSTDNITQQNVRTIYDYGTAGPFSPDGFLIGKPYVVTTLKGFKDYIGIVNGALTPMTGQLEKTVQSFNYPNPYLILNGQPPLPYHRWFTPNKTTTTQNRTGNSDYVRATSFKYNDAKGWLTESVQDPGTANAVTTAMTYNGYGNLTAKSVSAVDLPTVTDNYEYDPSQRYLTKTYNSAYPALASVNTYEPSTGNLLTTKEADGLMTTYTYDAFGRKKTVSNNNGGFYSILYQWATGVPGAKYQVVTDNIVSEPSLSYCDRLGRQVRESYKGFSGEDIIKETTYNVKGQQETETLPRFAADAVLTTTYQYDLLGRQTQVVAPTGTTTYAYVSTPTAGGLGSGTNSATYKVTVTNPAGQAKAVTTDASGSTTLADDAGGQLAYTYNSIGSMKSTTLNGVAVQTTEYDNFGRKTMETDPNYGSYTYTYNAYDQVVTQKDAKNNEYKFTYNVLGDMQTKSGPEGLYDYTYSFAADNNAFKLTQLTGPEGTITYNYGKGAQILSEIRTTGTESFANAYTYDAKGQMAQHTYPDGSVIEYTYNPSDGSLSNLGVPGETYGTPMGIRPAYIHSITHKNAYGQVIAAGHGSAFYSGPINAGQPIETSIWSTFGYNQYGLLTAESTLIPASSSAPSTTLRNMQYTFSTTTSNLTIRKDVKYNKQEYFSYDNLNRLARAQYGTLNVFPPLVDLTYAGNGNINKKTDAGTFTYDEANRVSEINPYVNIPAAAQNTAYTPFNKIKSISEGGVEAVFTYWPDGQRASMELTGGANPRKVYYAPGYEKIVIPGMPVRQLSYVNNGKSPVAIMEKLDAVPNRYYVLTDYLGSITQILTANGTIIEEKNFDAWGRQRNPSTWLLNGTGYFAPTYASNGWDRGYTGHEHLPEFGIVNMNGRLYDPLMGRMFSPDPFIMGVDNTQGYNRYTYAMNNPLSFTDPTGEIAWFVPIIAGAVIGAYMGGTLANGSYNPGQWDFNSGKTWGYIAGGAIVGGASAAAGAAVAASGIPFANTSGIAIGSLINSAGTVLYTNGQTDLSISFGAASFNLSNGEFGFLGKSGNTLAENIGYGFGALANLQDGFAGLRGVSAKYRAETEDIQHARLRGEYKGKEFDISVAHLESTQYKWTSRNDVGLLNNLDYGRYWGTHVKSGIYFGGSSSGIELPIYNVNGKWLTSMFNRLGNGTSQGKGLWGIGKLKYGSTMYGCQSHVAHALLGVGIPTLPINFLPQVLYGQLFLRQMGIYTSPILTN